VRRATLRPTGADLGRVYRRLLRAFGPAGWWPGDSAIEVCLGAILTQNTSWKNVERALGELRARGVLSWEGLRGVPVARLARLLRPSGTYNVKARRVRAFLDLLGREYGGRAERLAGEETGVLRQKLLAVKGIGPETADSIVLYAAGGTVFVIDAYTRRVFSRLGLVRGDEPYEDIQAFFMRRLPADAALFNDYHAQVVRLAKDVCRARPRCDACPLRDLCPRRGVG
jgi:endonuclease-3 related protein